jgi:hypothetical protein
MPSDGIEPLHASVLYRGSTSEILRNITYTAHTSKNQKDNEPTMLQKMKHDDIAASLAHCELV